MAKSKKQSNEKQPRKKRKADNEEEKGFLDIPKLIRNSKVWSFESLVSNSKGLFKESENERVGDYSSLFKYVDSLIVENPISSEALLVLLNDFPMKIKNQFHSIADAFPILESRTFYSILLAFDSLSSDTLCQLVKVMEHGCYLINEAVSIKESDAPSKRNPDESFLLRIFTRHFLMLVVSLFKLSQNRKLKGSNLDKLLNSINSYTALLSENKKQIKMENLIELIHYSLPKLLVVFSNGGKKPGTTLWNAFQSLLELPFKEITDEEDLRKYHMKFSSFLTKMCMEGMVETQNVCTTLHEIHNQKEELSFIFLDYFIQLLQSMLEGANKKSKDISKAVELLSFLSKKIPKVVMMFISEMDFISNSSNGSIRKCFLDVIANLIEANIVNKDFLNTVLQRTNDKDAFVRTRAFQKIADISGQINWSNYEMEFGKFLNTSLEHISDKSKTTRVQSIHASLGLIQRNPFTKSFDLGMCREKLTKNEDLLDVYQLYKHNMIEKLGKTSFENTISFLNEYPNKEMIPFISETFESLSAKLENNSAAKLRFSSTKSECILFLYEENDLMDGISRIRSQLDFLNLIYDKFIPKILNTLRALSLEGPLFCKDSVQAVFNLLDKLTSQGLKIDWTKLISCLGKETHPTVIQRLCNLFISYFVDSNSKFQFEHILQSITNVDLIEPWLNLFSGIKTHFPNLSLRSLLDHCKGKLDMETTIFILLILLKLDSNLLIFIPFENILQNLKELIFSYEGKEKLISLKIRMVEQVYRITQDQLFKKSVDNFLEENISFLLLEFGRETLSLVYSTESNRRLAYYGIGKVESSVWKDFTEKQETDVDKMSAFFDLIGEVCYRDSLEIRAIATSKFNENSDKLVTDDDDFEGEEENCMKENQREQTKILVLERAVTESLTKGFLSRYVSLLKNSMQSRKTPKAVKTHAVLAIGKIMIVSKTLAREFYPLIISCLNNVFTNDGAPLIMSCLIVLADSFATLATESEENSGLLLKYIRHENEQIATLSRKLAQDLFDRKRCKASIQPGHSLQAPTN